MSAQHAQTGCLTPRMAEVLARIERAQQGKPRMIDLPAAQARAAYAGGAEVLDLPPAALAAVDDLTLPGGLHARLYAPREPHPYAPLPVLVYFHGGGFTIGSVATHNSLCSHLAHRSLAAVLSVDYRLAPEHRFPAAFDDAWTALRWVVDEGGAHGLDVRRVAVGGDSAGGTLAAACAIAARDAGLPLALQLLFYPGTTSHQTLPSQAEFARGFLIERTHIDWFFSQYLRSAQDRDDWRFAPLVHPDVRRVAPAWVGLADCDPVRDDGLAWADKLRAAGVEAEVVRYRGVVHDFIKMGRAIPEAVQAHADAAAALHRAFER